MVRCGLKNKYKKDMCLKDIGLHTQKMITILGSIVKILVTKFVYTCDFNRCYVQSWAYK